MSLKKTITLALLTFVIGSAAWIPVVGYFGHTTTYQRISAWFGKPSLVVWANTGSRVVPADDVQVFGQPMNKDDQFLNMQDQMRDPNPVRNADYVLILLDSIGPRPSEDLAQGLKLQPKHLAPRITYTTERISSASVGLRFHVMPVFYRHQMLIFVNVTHLSTHFDPECHRDILVDVITTQGPLGENFPECRLAPSQPARTTIQS